ncbi:glycosyltransferase family 2 protein [Rhizobium sp. CSW-27]|uniref:glycosyltransferase family 2 protein n=1 Tax=Rhizobium sp. CSW-27 TaxID=2839985 RepID=UPI0020788E56|nr:glycosyltransferase family 2 protein [Rhizobium sp. CSW-27]
MSETGEYPPTMADLRKRVLAHRGWLHILEAGQGEDTEASVLVTLGFSASRIAALAAEAASNGTTIETELLHSGATTEDAYYRAVARFFRLPFMERIDPQTVVDLDGLDTQLVQPLQVRLTYPNRAPQIAMVPRAEKLPEFAAFLARKPALRDGLVITTPSALRAAVWEAGSARRVRRAATDLFDMQPHLSARIITTGTQGLVAGSMLTALAAICIAMPAILLPLLHITITLLYFACLALRMVALVEQRRQRRRAPALPQPVEEPLPVYSVMVAIYREADMVPQLVASLQRLEWPRSRLDIKIVCERDDAETLAALDAQKLPPHFEVVKVPPYHPRTKPKALAYALAAARGEFLAIYDAEDRPHPGQLMEAYRRFRSSGPELACLQAPLIISNVDENHISALFAMEYAALFRGLLPMLSRYRMPLPLGGTSNHFRTAVLRRVGGWDPFNVTEDADLGLRLYRLGYRSETLRCQTLEEAPVSRAVWIGQRTRWFKGWLQTWLVMTRNPLLTARQMGWRAMLVFHLLIGGMLFSALLHPLILVLFIKALLLLAHTPLAEMGMLTLGLMLMDGLNVIASYLVFLGLGMGSMIGLEKLKVGRRWIAVPMHWMMSSYAAWRAVNELRTNPFFWKKTPHRPARTARAGEASAAPGEWMRSTSVQRLRKALRQALRFMLSLLNQERWRGALRRT